MPEPGEQRRKKDNHLRALVGQNVSDRFFLDLRTQGPHALVGGTTGAGKSEFLQSWILGMATAHSPRRVTFLYVDYKGGAAFADCVNLPHSVGMVTDLSPHLVRRALQSLNAELRTRESLLNRKKAKDLLELERRNDPDCPPSLVIIVDEFAALVSEVPEFVDGVINVAQRGRSLGLHLILATQQPSGVIKGNLRANTNLRVALRMADEADSSDVIGTPHAATFDPDLPGRAVAKTGPGRLTSFQSAYVGGWTSNEPPKPSVSIEELRFGGGQLWEAAEDISAVVAATGPNDIHRVVQNVARAADMASIDPPRKPWMPELASLYRLEDLPSTRTDRELVFGVIDKPDDQTQPVVGFAPDTDGNMAVYGTGGSGKSTFLRTLAIASGFSPARGGLCTVYAFDFGARALDVLQTLPHVAGVIGAEDNERIVRVLRLLRATIDDRAVRFAKANASTIQEYRDRTANHDEPRLFLLIDNFGAFRQAYELGPNSRWFETFQSIAADGRGVGVHVIISADRPGAVPASVSSSIQRHLVLRLGNEMDYSTLGVPDDVFDSTSPPGRGFLDGCDVQVAVFGGDPVAARQATAISKLSGAMKRAGVNPAPPVESLPSLIPVADLPAVVSGLPVLGINDDTLQPLTFEPTGAFLVVGPPQSGKTMTVATMVRNLRIADPRRTFALFASPRSLLAALSRWDHIAASASEIDEMAAKLAAMIVADDPTTSDLVVVVEAIGDLLSTEADPSLQELFKACRTMDRFIISEGETGTVVSSWPLLQAAKASRYGIAMQPEQMDGDSIFKTTFPRGTRADFPQGRGVFVRSGRIARVQVAFSG